MNQQELCCRLPLSHVTTPANLPCCTLVLVVLPSIVCISMVLRSRVLLQNPCGPTLLCREHTGRALMPATHHAAIDFLFRVGCSALQSLPKEEAYGFGLHTVAVLYHHWRDTVARSPLSLSAGLCQGCHPWDARSYSNQWSPIHAQVVMEAPRSHEESGRAPAEPSASSPTVSAVVASAVAGQSHAADAMQSPTMRAVSLAFVLESWETLKAQGRHSWVRPPPQTNRHSHQCMAPLHHRPQAAL